MVLQKMFSAWRRQEKLSIRKAAKRIGITHSALFRFENNREVESRQLITIMRWALTK